MKPWKACPILWTNWTHAAVISTLDYIAARAEAEAFSPHEAETGRRPGHTERVPKKPPNAGAALLQPASLGPMTAAACSPAGKTQPGRSTWTRKGACPPAST
ncbi:MAG: hypothetical protein ACLSHC_02355 [Bilophila wadsworthia]